MSDDEKRRRAGVSRRDFLKGLSAGVATTGLVGVASGERPAEGQAEAPAPALGPGKVPVTLRINGKTHQLSLEPRVTLLNALRNHLDLTGAKKICDRGECGGCTVLVDGKTAYSCMMLAVDAQGKEITTVEGLAEGDKLTPVQQAFIEHDALMCGFCTPGFVVSVTSLLKKNPNPTLEDVKEATAGNTCRCGTYPRVFEAALAAAKQMRGSG